MFYVLVECSHSPQIACLQGGGILASDAQIGGLVEVYGQQEGGPQAQQQGNEHNGGDQNRSSPFSGM
jgi:hypothetical protein